jgi:hypothetical protein
MPMGDAAPEDDDAGEGEDPGEALFVLVRRRSRRHSRQRGVASTYAIVDMPTICA